jgi:phasin family protein
MFPMNLFQAAGFPFSNAGLSKTWVGLGAPSFKIDALFEMHRKTADAVVSANYVVLDGLHKMAQRQGELFAASVNDYTKVTRDVFARASLEEKASSQVGAVRDVYASTVASLRELSDIAVNTNVIVADILTTRVREALDEFGVLLGKPVATTASSVVATAVVAEPVGSVEEAPVSVEATLVEAVPTVSPSAKTEPKKAMPPARPGRAPTSGR